MDTRKTLGVLQPSVCGEITPEGNTYFGLYRLPTGNCVIPVFEENDVEKIQLWNPDVTKKLNEFQFRNTSNLLFGIKNDSIVFNHNTGLISFIIECRDTPSVYAKHYFRDPDAKPIAEGSLTRFSFLKTELEKLKKQQQVLQDELEDQEELLNDGKVVFSKRNNGK